MPEHNHLGDRIFFWVDEDGVRCSPRHRTLKAALAYFKDQEHYWVTDGSGRPRQVDRDRETLPSQKQPKDLRVGEYVERELDEETRLKVEQVKDLMDGGYV